ncbi:MAG: magnesium/cobalt transporter CorA [Acidobacteria bacterium]|jgi:magnesium transporter|nr:magnesium/cobalt transporter CorA [Acidobacteriota bacterium]
MVERAKKRSIKAGMSPGTLVHIGAKRVGESRIRILDYDEQGVREKNKALLDECVPFRDTDTVTWIDIEGLHDIAMLDQLGQCYGLHPLILEDILNTDQRPKTDDMESYIYVVLKMLDFEPTTLEIVSEQVSVVFGRNYVISLQEGREGDLFEPLRERIRGGKGRIRKMGPDYLAYALLDTIIDHYFVILEKFAERIEMLEEELVSDPRPETLHQIHRLKREMIFLRKSAWPLREVVNALEKSESDLIRPATKIFLRDIYDHAIHIVDSIESYREMLSSMLDIYLSSVSNRMNQVMKVLTIIATIFMPLTFLAGVYGMNFKFMPELGWRWGYPLVLLVMAGAAGAMIHFFKKKNWL